MFVSSAMKISIGMVVVVRICVLVRDSFYTFIVWNVCVQGDNVSGG